MNIMQAELQHGPERLTTWLDVQPGLKVGAMITLKGYSPDQLWYVSKLYSSVHNSTEFDFHRKWDNNDYQKHNGLKIHGKT